MSSSSEERRKDALNMVYFSISPSFEILIHSSYISGQSLPHDKYYLVLEVFHFPYFQYVSVLFEFRYFF